MDVSGRGQGVSNDRAVGGAVEHDGSRHNVRPLASGSRVFIGIRNPAWAGRARAPAPKRLRSDRADFAWGCANTIEVGLARRAGNARGAIDTQLLAGRALRRDGCRQDSRRLYLLQ